MSLKFFITIPYREEHLEIPVKLNETLIALLLSFLRSNIILSELYYQSLRFLEGGIETILILFAFVLPIFSIFFLKIFFFLLGQVPSPINVYSILDILLSFKSNVHLLWFPNLKPLGLLGSDFNS